MKDRENERLMRSGKRMNKYTKGKLQGNKWKKEKNNKKAKI